MLWLVQLMGDRLITCILIIIITIAVSIIKIGH